MAYRIVDALSLQSPPPASPLWFSSASSGAQAHMPCTSSTSLFPGQSSLPRCRFIHTFSLVLVCCGLRPNPPIYPAWQASERVPRARALSMHMGAFFVEVHEPWFLLYKQVLNIVPYMRRRPPVPSCTYVLI